MRHLLVTNDFPPKIGGIQNYLWELWRRLPAETASVYTTPHPGATAFDAAQPFWIERSPEPFLIPYPWLASRVARIAADRRADLVILDPAIPLGTIGPSLGMPYGVVLHGAEVTIPGRLPGLRPILARTLRSAEIVISAGEYALREAERCAGRTLPSVVIPPGVDHERFIPAAADTRAEVRNRFGLDRDDLLLATVSRLVPRKGMATLIRAAARVAAAGSQAPGGSSGGSARLRVVIGGTGREERSLQQLIDDLDAPVTLTGRLSDQEVVDLYGAADLMAMVCNERWFGLEQEGFGIVFLEAAAAGLPQVAGRSGGAHEAVADGETGLIVDDPLDIESVAAAIRRLMDDGALRRAMGEEARRRAVKYFDYDDLAGRLDRALSDTIGPGTAHAAGDS